MSWHNNNVNKNLKLFKGYTFFKGLDLTRGLFLIYLLDQGLTNSQVGLLQSLLFASTFLLEVPSGIMADKFKRKYSLLFGGILLAASYFVYLFTNSFWVYALIFISFGASFASQSGADAALLYDGLKETGSKWLDKYSSILGTNYSLGTMATTIAMVSAGFIYEFNPKLIFIISGSAAIISFVCVIFINESSHKKSDADEDSIGVIQSLKTFLSSNNGKKLFFFMLGMALIEAFHTPFFIFSQKLFLDSGVEKSHISSLLATSFLLSSFGMYVSGKLPIKNQLKFIVLTIVILILSCISLAFTTNIAFIIILFLIVQVVPNMLFIHTDKYIMDHCSSEIRASLMSVSSLINSIFISISYTLMGFSIDIYGIKETMGLLGLILLLAPIFFIIHLKKGENCENVQVA